MGAMIPDFQAGDKCSFKRYAPLPALKRGDEAVIM
jgi:hypothetical protein